MSWMTSLAGSEEGGLDNFRLLTLIDIVSSWCIAKSKSVGAAVDEFQVVTLPGHVAFVRQRLK